MTRLVNERNGCPFVQIQSRSQQVNSFFLYCTSFPTNISELGLFYDLYLSILNMTSIGIGALFFVNS